MHLKNINSNPRKVVSDSGTVSYWTQSRIPVTAPNAAGSHPHTLRRSHTHTMEHSHSVEHAHTLTRSRAHTPTRTELMNEPHAHTLARSHARTHARAHVARRTSHVSLWITVYHFINIPKPNPCTSTHGLMLCLRHLVYRRARKKTS